MIERITAEEAAQARTPAKRLVGGVLAALASLALFGLPVTVVATLAVVAVVVTRPRGA